MSTIARPPDRASDVSIRKNFENDEVRVWWECILEVLAATAKNFERGMVCASHVNKLMTLRHPRKDAASALSARGARRGAVARRGRDGSGQGRQDGRLCGPFVVPGEVHLSSFRQICTDTHSYVQLFTHILHTHTFTHADTHTHTHTQAPTHNAHIYIVAYIRLRT